MDSTPLQKARRIRRWATIALIAIFAIIFFSLNIYPSYSSGDDPKLSEISHLTKNIPYCTGQNGQVLDLYTPSSTDDYPDDGAPYPLVIYVHGGGWRKGDKQNTLIEYYGAELSKEGFAIASVNYRLAPKFRYPAQNDDVACAIKTLAEKADQYKLDTQNVILFGDSAGSLLASSYALSARDKPVTIRGVISFYGTTDLVSQLKRAKHNPNAYAYLGTRDTDIARAASPLFQPITNIPPPFLFFHGTKDTVVSIDQALNLYHRIAAYRPSSRFVRINNAPHGFGDSNSTKPSSSDIRRALALFALRHIGYLNESEADEAISSLQ